VQYYEKARRLLPRDHDVRFNLAFVRNRLEEEPPRPGFISSVITRIVLFFSVDELLVIEPVAVLFLAALWMVHTRSKRRRSSRRRITGLLIGATGLVVLLSLTFLAVQVVEQSDTEAVVIVDRIDARSGPSEDLTKVLSIPEGTMVWVDEQRKDWFLIHIATGRGGWLPVDSVGVI
jgi:hypothetical protein